VSFQRSHTLFNNLVSALSGRHAAQNAGNAAATSPVAMMNQANQRLLPLRGMT
jgi:hypothetical protein